MLDAESDPPARPDAPTSRQCIALPKFDVPGRRPRTWRLHFSITSQVDGLLFACLGCRIERDVLADDASASCVARYGLSPWESLAAFFGLYLVSSWQDLPGIVAALVSHRGRGVVISPVWPGRPPDVRLKSAPMPWFDFLASRAALSFPLPGGALRRLADDAEVDLPFGLTAIAVNFGSSRWFKSKRRPETHIPLPLVPDLADDGPQLGVRPRLYPMVSPDDIDPSPELDRQAPSPAFVADPAGPPSFAQMRTAWNVEDFRRWSTSFPCPRVRDLALSVLGGTLDVFRGVRSKAVDVPSRASKADLQALARKQMLKALAACRPASDGGSLQLPPLPQLPHHALWHCEEGQVRPQVR